MIDPIGGAPETDAAFWAVHLESAGDDPRVQAELEAWLNADPRRAGALLRAQATLALLSSPAGVTEVTAAAPTARPTPQPRGVSRRRILVGGGLLVASAALAALLLPTHAALETEVGEIRQAPLADGSTVALNTASRLAISYGDGERRLVLPRGEAMFRVAPSADRPFVVVAGSVVVVAVGTVFSVRHRDPGVEVLVTEGLVEVTDGSRAPVRLSAGERGVFGAVAPPSVIRVSPEAASRMLAWRTGQVEFDGDPAEVAIAEVNRYNRRKIRLVDPTQRHEPVFGAYRTDDPLGFAFAMAAALGLTVEESEREIRLVAPAN